MAQLDRREVLLLQTPQPVGVDRLGSSLHLDFAEGFQDRDMPDQCGGRLAHHDLSAATRRAQAATPGPDSRWNARQSPNSFHQAPIITGDLGPSPHLDKGGQHVAVATLGRNRLSSLGQEINLFSPRPSSWPGCSAASLRAES